MKFMLMMHAPRGNGEYAVAAWAPEDLQAHIRFMQKLNADLQSAGELVAAEGLAPPGQAKLVRATDGGVRATDGPFAESKEFLVGFWIVDVDGPERAFEIAATASAAPGPGGSRMSIPIEVRQVVQAPPA